MNFVVLPDPEGLENRSAAEVRKTRREGNSGAKQIHGAKEVSGASEAPRNSPP